MFAQKLNALMNIAEVSNSLMGRNVNINPSYIGRLRSGVRPLPKRHEYLVDICRCLTKHITKDYQITALQKLTGITDIALSSTENTVLYLEQWILEQDGMGAFGEINTDLNALGTKSSKITQDYERYLYGNSGKRKAVEQFFSMILQEKNPQTLLLFSDENMAWLYEDIIFAKHWAELFMKVILKGNRVRIIHTVSRDMNEMLEAITKWIPIYTTGMVEPYCYPRLRDGVFQRTMFIAPNTVAVVSSSVQQNTDEMLNLCLTDRTALKALTAEYERYLSLCRPLMYIFTKHDRDKLTSFAENIVKAEGNAYLCCTAPPLFTMPEELVRELSLKFENEKLIAQWQQSLLKFRNHIEKQQLSLLLLKPECVFCSADTVHIVEGEVFSVSNITYNNEQYNRHIAYLKQMEHQYKNLKVHFLSELPSNTPLYVKENRGVIMANIKSSDTTFVITEQNMTKAFLDYLEKLILKQK